MQLDKIINSIKMANEQLSAADKANEKHKKREEDEEEVDEVDPLAGHHGNYTGIGIGQIVVP